MVGHSIKAHACLALLTAFAILLEPLLCVELPRSTLRPDLLLVPFVTAIVRWPGPIAVVWAAVIGLIDDCLGGNSLGPQMGLLGVLAAVGSCAVGKRSLTAIEFLLFSFGLTFTCELIVSQFRASPASASIGVTASVAGVAGPALTTSLLISGFCLGRRLSERARWRPGLHIRH